jgi:xanthine dehydrogenase accessory factor
MESHFAELDQLLNRHGRLVIATIVRTTGSTPRKAGARIILLPDGTTHDTLGGGSFEAQVQRDGMTLLVERRGELRRYALVEESDTSSPALCGGEAEVFFDYFETAPRLLIFGAGHCGQALLRAAALLGFRLGVADQRADLIKTVQGSAGPAGVETCILKDDLDGLPPIDPSTFVVIMTNSHELDERILRRVINIPAAYMGMIASRNKAASIRQRLIKDGFAPEAVAAVHMPIGLPIGSQAPAEIAVSVLAEIVATLHKNS